jgi:tRNA-specific 2-thiouridylase
MSGGVDSSVAAFLLRRDGYDCAGAMMGLFGAVEGDDARAVAQTLGIPFHVFDFSEVFAEKVLARFVSAYRGGITPNPCVDCNRFVKFRRFLQQAGEMGFPFIATGHYARVERDANGRYLLKKGLDETKDQSYMLYTLTQGQLARTLFPLGGLTKEEARGIAADAGFANAQKSESQDICFVPDGDYAGFIRRHVTSVHGGQKLHDECGDFIDHKGKPLGRHKGLIHYTIGQRKGLGISAPHPLYVIALNAENNTVTLGPSERLFSGALAASGINLIPFDTLPSPLRVTAKIRYNQQAQPATVRQTGPDRLCVTFDKPQRAVTPGQAVVLYDGDAVIGGGTITGPHSIRAEDV